MESQAEQEAAEQVQVVMALQGHIVKDMETAVKHPTVQVSVER
jgi:hypothetical protein